MAKKKKKKGKPTIARCSNCAFERQYERRFVFSDNPHFYCGRLQEPLTLWQKVANFFSPTFLDGVGSANAMKKEIRFWIINDAEFNWFGRDIGKNHC